MTQLYQYSIITVLTESVVGLKLLNGNHHLVYRLEIILQNIFHSLSFKPSACYIFPHLNPAWSTSWIKNTSFHNNICNCQPHSFCIAVFHLHYNPLRESDSFRIYSLKFYSHVTYSSCQDRLFLYLFSETFCCFHYALFLSVDQYISLRVADVFSGQQQSFFSLFCVGLS